MKTSGAALALLSIVLLACSISNVNAAMIVIVNNDGPEVGFNDCTPATPCHTMTGVLGSAGTSLVVHSFTNAPSVNASYPIALASALAGEDLAITYAVADGASITAQFNGTAGQDASNHPKLYTALPGENGSSVYHFDTTATPNKLMEPTINGDLTHDVDVPHDLTTKALLDMGWSALAALAPPTGVAATATASTNVRVSWTAAAGAVSYRVYRSSNNSTYTLLVGSPAASPYDDGTAAANTAYLYKVHSFDGTTESGDSNVDLATTVMFTNSLTPGVTPIRAVDFTELRTAADAVGVLTGLGVGAYTDVPLNSSVTVKAVHMVEIKTKVNSALTALGRTLISFPDPVAGTLITADQISQVRSSVRGFLASATLHHFLVEAQGGGPIGTQIAGTPFNLRITAQDVNNVTVSGFTGTVDVTSNRTGSAGLVTTVAFTNGVLASHSVTLTQSGPLSTITATRTSGTENGTSDPFTVNAGAPANIIKQAGDNQSAIVGMAVATPPAVKFTDSHGNPVQGVNVTFAAASGGGNVSGGGATSGTDGIATVGSWTLGTTAGTNTLTATATGGLTTTFTATGIAPFDVTNAASTNAATITVTYNAVPNAGQATTIGNYSVPGLALSGTPTLNGNTVTITTSAQSAISYTVTVSGVTRASDAQPLTVTTANFTGTAVQTPTVTNVVVTSTNPNNGAIPYNTGTATVKLTGTDFATVVCPGGVKLDDLDGVDAAVGTTPTSCTVDSDTQITATWPAGIRTKATTGWNVLVTNTAGSNATGAVKFVPVAGLLVSEVYTGTAGSTDHEYVEVYNPTGTAIDTTGIGLRMHIRSGTGTDTNRTLTAVTGAVIPSHGFLLIVSSASTGGDGWFANRDYTYSDGVGPLVANGGVYLSLSNTGNAKVIDKAGWGTQPAFGFEGTALANIPSGNSAERKPAGSLGHATDTDDNSLDFYAPSATLTPRGTVDGTFPLKATGFGRR